MTPLFKLLVVAGTPMNATIISLTAAVSPMH